MKTLLTLIVVLSCFCASAQQPSPALGSVTLGWTASTTTNSGPLSYWILVGTNSGVYFSQQGCGTNLQGTVIGLARGITYYFSTTCTTTNQVTSDYSNTTNYMATLKPVPPVVTEIIVNIP